MSNLVNNRPISPHLQIYKLIPTMFVSIAHRISGVVVYFGTVVFVLWFMSLAGGVDKFNVIRYFSDFALFRVCLFLYTWAVIHHMLGGIRYLIWDSGFCFDKHIANRLAKINLVSSVLIVILIYLINIIYLN
ncbi:MAG: succinate dehydrogenase, cytochrome b556 subunit [Candidatus Liberibacter europaeus]|uniref:Succinate dehydrogenase cytochrome b556 subunit n=1 Tax=Candidatus Liberibacter europaeus TaxID=744859 RepID=A0A2T4VW83_9HYPH|nr:succinate dehydrogenase, cytochrome b556 subunit [Candidatus Liberibacter europaeus]PTL86044.1 MAG: succinate dehydrogenase, cytochrome b556 subunit [Candidatus Liberibacter europaeus]